MENIHHTDAVANWCVFCSLHLQATFLFYAVVLRHKNSILLTKSMATMNLNEWVFETLTEIFFLMLGIRFQSFWIFSLMDYFSVPTVYKIAVILALLSICTVQITFESESLYKFCSIDGSQPWNLLTMAYGQFVADISKKECMFLLSHHLEKNCIHRWKVLEK